MRISDRIYNKDLYPDSWNVRYRRVVLKQLPGGLIISNCMLPLKGYECPTCGKMQPFEDWWCAICGGPSIMGEPDGDDLDPEFDNYFETDEECVLIFLRITRFGNYLYKRA